MVQRWLARGRRPVKVSDSVKRALMGKGLNFSLAHFTVRFVFLFIYFFYLYNYWVFCPTPTVPSSYKKSPIITPYGHGEMPTCLLIHKVYITSSDSSVQFYFICIVLFNGHWLTPSVKKCGCRFRSLMGDPEATVERTISRRWHEEESLRGTRVIWSATDCTVWVFLTTPPQFLYCKSTWC